MPQRCPVCKAENAAGPQCRRCKADLGMLFALEDHRSALLSAARDAYANGKPRAALETALAADNLRPDAQSQRWLAFLQLLAGNYEAAWRSYQAAYSHG